MIVVSSLNSEYALGFHLQQYEKIALFGLLFLENFFRESVLGRYGRMDTQKGPGIAPGPVLTPINQMKTSFEKTTVLRSDTRAEQPACCL